MKSKAISISKGPQFRGGKSAYLFIFLLFILLILIVLLVQGFYIAPLVMTPVVVLLTFFILDIQGVDIDKNKNQIRSYKLHPWGKTGEWKSLDGFKYLSLDNQTFTVKIRSFYTNTMSISDNYNTENHSHFLTLLVHEKGEESIILAEHLNYNDAKSESVKISKQIGYPVQDDFRQKMIDSKRKRGR